MLGRCPIKTSKEWLEILDSVNGNEQRALEEWNKRTDLLERDDLHEIADEQEEMEFADEEEADPTNFDNVVKKIKVLVAQRFDELTKRKVKNQKFKEEELKRLQKQIKELDAVGTINLFVDDSFIKAQTAARNFNKILSQRKNNEINNKDFLDRLVDINDFANSYNILDEIAKVEIDEYFSAPITNKPISEYTPQDKIKFAIQTRDQIKLAFVEQAIPLMAETLIDYRSGKSNKTIKDQIKAYQDRIEELENSDFSDKIKEKDTAYNQRQLSKWQKMLLDKENLEEILKISVKDESVFNYLIDPLISSEDSAIALFAKMIKSNFEEVRMEDIIERDTLVDNLNDFKDKTGNSVNNVASLNEGLYEEVSVLRRNNLGKAVRDAEGLLIFDKKMSFVQKYDLNKYAQAQSEWYKSNPKPILKEDPSLTEQAVYDVEIRKWYAERKAWYARNTQAKSKEEIQKILKEKEKDLEDEVITAEEYDDWKKTVIYEVRGQKVFMNELAEPSNKYLNTKWKLLYNEEGAPISPEGVYHKQLTDTYLKDQEYLPLSQQPGLILPSIPMQEWERLQRQGALKTAKIKLKESVKRQEYDQDTYGTELSSGDNSRILPVYYTQNIDIKDVSVDLLSSVILFGSMARRYNAMNKVHSEITAFKTIIGKRKTPELDGKGNPIFNSVAKRFGFDQYLLKNGQSYSKLHLDAFIEMVIQGESQKAEYLAGKEVSKIANTLMGISAVTTIAADVLKGVANNIQGNIQVLIEAVGGEFFNGKNLARGNVKYWATVGGNISDFAKLKPESWLGKLIETYDPIQGNFKDEFGKNVSASVANKLFRTSNLFFTNNFGEHEIQVKTMLALMDATKVIDKESKKEITLLEAHEKYGSNMYEVKTDENGKKYKDYKIQVTIETSEGVEETIDFNERERQAFMNTLHALNKRMHGVYNDFDKSTAQRYSLGRLLMMYRKHLVPGYKRRYKTASYDEELESPTEGTYRVFWRTFLKDTARYKFKVATRWSGYTPFEKSQIKKVVAELTIIVALAALIIALESMVDDDDDDKEKKLPYVYNFMMYEALRMRSETAAYFSPSDAYRVFRSPSAVMGTIDRTTKFIEQFIFTWDPEKLNYKRDTGVWNKGDNKSWAYFLKLMGFSGYNLTPEEASKSFKSTFVK